MVVWWRLGSVLYRIMSRKKTGQLKVLVYEGWTLSMEIISSTILRCDFSSMKLPIKMYMCTHLKTVICFHQSVPSSSLQVNYLAIFFVYNFSVSSFFIHYKKHMKLHWSVNKITKIPSSSNSTLILMFYYTNNFPKHCLFFT